MRLLKVPEQGTDDLPELVDFPPGQIPSYAILSHRWGAPTEEVLFADITAKDRSSWRSTIQAKAGFLKLKNCCAQARKDGLSYIWVQSSILRLRVLGSSKKLTYWDA